MESGHVLIAAGNTYNPALVVLQQRGYRLWVEEAGEGLLWSAGRDKNEFAAYSPPELLGIVTLWEALGEGWNVQSPDVLRELTSSYEAQKDHR